MNINLQTLSVTELKALAFDVLVAIESNNKNLQLVNNEIAKRSQEPSVTPKSDETETKTESETKE